MCVCVCQITLHSLERLSGCPVDPEDWSSRTSTALHPDAAKINVSRRGLQVETPAVQYIDDATPGFKFNLEAMEPLLCCLRNRMR